MAGIGRWRPPRPAPGASPHPARLVQPDLLHQPGSLAVRLFEPPMETPRLTEVLQWHRLRDGDLAVQCVREQIAAGARALPAI